MNKTLAALVLGLVAGMPAHARAPTTPAHESEGSANPKSVQSIAAQAAYQVRDRSGTDLVLAPPKLPDLSGYTAAAVMKKLVTHPAASVSVQRMQGEPALAEFTGGDERMMDWARRQQTNPRAIFIENGYLRPRDLARLLPRDQFAELEPGVYLAFLPIVVKHGATLHIDRETKDFRLSEDHGSFLVNDGKLFITDSRLTGWRESTQGPASFRAGDRFRPFVISWGGTETYISGSVVASLGYAKSKSYGVSISQYSPSTDRRMKRAAPTGWIINSDFSDLWYGFYCYEADDLVLRGNTYRDNIVYGIDPHDRSKRLIIAENIAHGTKKKHGIIVSREVNDSWIFRNKSYDNHLSGIVIDRSSINNVIAYNDAHANKSNGITIYESSDNLIWGNRITGNRRHGVLLRNSIQTLLHENEIAANGLTGIYGATKDLTGTARNIKLDPFDPRVSMIVVGGRLLENGTSPLKIETPQSATLYDVELLSFDQKRGIKFSGVLSQFQEQILDILIRQKRAAVIEPVTKSHPLSAVAGGN
ncbi:MAG: mannuronan 5-epimerase AlgG [Porticoccaceae bacterium]